MCVSTHSQEKIEEFGIPNISCFWNFFQLSVIDDEIENWKLSTAEQSAVVGVFKKGGEVAVLPCCHL